MLNGLYSAAAGMIAQQTRMDALANDISNVNTTGYKQIRMGFRDLIYNIESGMRVGAGSALVDAGREFSPGAFQQTGDPLSLAIAGPGFFQVRLADGRMGLTRSGDFKLDANGGIVTATGQRLMPPITIPPGTSMDSISVSTAGVVKVGTATVGTIGLVNVASPDQLQPVGDSLFVATAQSGAVRAVPGATIQQGFLEASNVNLADAMVNVIDAQRSFQFDSKVIQTQDQLMEIANGIPSLMMPPIDTSLIPPEVRNAGPEAEKLYNAALQFEGMLTSQITQQMFDAAKDLGGDDENGDPNPYQSMLPSALSDSLTAAGGLGLAPELYRSFGGAYLSGGAASAPAGSGDEAAG